MRGCEGGGGGVVVLDGGSEGVGAVWLSSSAVGWLPLVALYELGSELGFSKARQGGGGGLVDL